MEKLTIQQYEATVEARLWSKVHKSEACWLWKGRITANGYGVMDLRYPGSKTSREVRAHRYLFEMYNGPITEGLDIDHICHNRACLKPSHLRATTRKQNSENRKGAAAGSKSGVRGVTWLTGRNRWRATVGHEGKQVHVGTFRDLAEAEAAVIAKRNELFTHNDLDRKAA